ncbi:MAG: Rrf2 family transcriptional regulator [candidate division NC10 bacterium]
MRLSRETEYALQGLVFLARQGDGAVVQLADIASAQSIPSTFLSKIFQKLVRYGLLRSHRGSLRGYSLGRTANEISVREILEATEGQDLFIRCAFSHNICEGDENPCVLHKVWKKSTVLLREELETLSLADLTGQWLPDAAHRKHRQYANLGFNRQSSGRRKSSRPIAGPSHRA